MKKAAKILLINKKKEALLYLRDNKPSISHPGYWDLIGGEVERNETPLEAVKREVTEEIGIEAENIKLIGKFNEKKSVFNPDGCEIYVFEGTINKSPDEIILNEGQEKSARFFKLEDLLKIKFSQSYKDFLIKIKYMIYFNL